MKWPRLTIAATALLAACAREEGAPPSDLLMVHDVVIGETVLNDVASMYASFHNTGPEDTLRAVLIEGVGRVEIHDQWQDGEVVRMEPLPNLVVPEDGFMRLAPGGRHFMLMGLTRTMAAGDSALVSFRFARAGEVDTWAPVVGLAEVLTEDPAGERP